MAAPAPAAEVWFGCGDIISIGGGGAPAPKGGSRFLLFLRLGGVGPGGLLLDNADKWLLLVVLGVDVI